MSLLPSRWIKGEILNKVRAAGAIAAGVAKAEPVEDLEFSFFEDWLNHGCHGEMRYMERYLPQRRDPRLLLAGARSIISIAFPYRPSGGYHHPHIADYALGEDYHYVIKEQLKPIIRCLAEEYGALSRICVDTAPILERYWAVRSGVGFIGLNKQLIVPAVGSEVFLAEIITSLELEPDTPLGLNCGLCRKCVKSCPTGALASDGSFDACKCRSYLTIEHRGPLPSDIDLGESVYGCDICQRVCPHNSVEAPETIDSFRPNPALLSLDRNALAHLSSGDWRRLTRRSAMNRIPYSLLRRNLGLF